MRDGAARWLGVVVLVIVGQLGAPARVTACTGRACSAGVVLPEEGGTVPANAVELLFREPVAKLETVPVVTSLHLFRVEGAERTELPTFAQKRDGLLHISPQQPVPAGSTLVLEYAEPCRIDSDAGVPIDLKEPQVVQRVVRVAPEAARPSSLGSLSAEVHHGPVELSGGSLCSRSYDGVYADVTVELDAAAKPYADSLRYVLEVDGHSVESYGFYHGYYEPIWRLGASQLGAGRDLLFALCDSSAGKAQNEQTEGTHAVRMKALLADDTEIWSDEVKVTLRCKGGATESCALSQAGAGSALSSVALVALLLALARARRVLQRRLQ